MAEIPVIFCFDDRILKGAGVSILSLLDAAAPTTVYAVHIFHPGLAAPVLDIAGVDGLAVHPLFFDMRKGFADGHIPGAFNLDVATELSRDSLSRIVGKDEEVVLSCHGKTCPEEADERGQAQQGSRDATHHREQQRGQV